MDFQLKLKQQMDKSCEFLTKHIFEQGVFSKDVDCMLQKIKKDVDEFRRTGKIPSFDNRTSEAQDLAVQVKKEMSSPEKPVRKALKESQASEKDSYTQEIAQSVQVKKEKITNILPRESIENMPPPPDGMILKKTIKTENNSSNTRSTRTRTRRQKELEEQKGERKDSDVIIQNTTLVTIDLSSDEDKAEKTQPQRATRTKTRAAQKKAEEAAVESAKRSRSPSEDSNKSKSSRTKKTKKKKAEEPEGSVYEDAVAAETPVQPEPVAAAENNPLNVTHVKEDNNLKDIMTDDESPVPAANKTIVLTKGSSKQLFSPFDHSPVKKKVEAFEKLGATAALAAAGTPVLTRKATKTLANQKKEAKDSTLESSSMDSVKSKSKIQTPLGTNRFIPSHFSTNCTKLKKPSLTDSSPLTKARSAIKASAADFKERELKRQRDAEALQKRDALLKAQLEEKRRIRAEKQLKAQQAREAKDKEKQKHFEMMEKMKEEKYNNHLAEKMQKQKEELGKKKQVAKARVVEEKKELPLPVYMTTKLPLLPTPDCYDSDSEECRRVVLPSWTTGETLKITSKSTHYICPQLKNTLFCVTAQTIDLTEIFQGIDPRKLKRTSSAVWTKPPRFTLMPGLNSSLDVTKEEDE